MACTSVDLAAPAGAAPQPAALPGVFVETYGCQMNLLDSELVQGQLAALGYPLEADPQKAGVVLLNTCSVRDLCEQKVWSYLGRLAIRRKQQPELIVGILGCMAEREGEAIFARAPHVELICGPSDLDRLPTLLDNVRRNRQLQVSLAGHRTRRSSTRERAHDSLEGLDMARLTSPISSSFSAYVRITRGCNKFCSFCVVPYTRGPEVHRSRDSLIEEIRRLVDRGIKEVTLLGQTINHWEHAADGKTERFADLLFAIHEQVPQLPRLRFLTSYPRDFSDAALQVMAACKRICRYLHVPGQSGSNAVLRRMNRGYTVEQYREFLARARAFMPDICLAGDMIVGFPGETDADHQASLDLLETIRLKSCYVFKYSPRPNTVAHRRLVDDVPDALKKARNQQMLQVQATIGQRLMERYVGAELEILVESKTRLRQATSAPPSIRVAWEKRPAMAPEDASLTRLIGRTAGDELVAFDGPEALIGQFTRVRGVRVTPLTVFAEAV